MVPDCEVRQCCAVRFGMVWRRVRRGVTDVCVCKGDFGTYWWRRGEEGEVKVFGSLWVCAWGAGWCLDGGGVVQGEVYMCCDIGRI